MKGGSDPEAAAFTYLSAEAFFSDIEKSDGFVIDSGEDNIFAFSTPNSAPALDALKRCAIEESKMSSTGSYDASNPPTRKAKPIELEMWLKQTDYPLDARRDNLEGHTEYVIDIDPHGVPGKCVITKTSGHPTLDRRTCITLKRWARFEPAKNEKGERVWDRYTGSIEWKMKN